MLFRSATIKDAEDAQTAIAQAIAVLRTFYKESGEVAKEAWESFVQLKAEIGQVEARIISRRQANLDATLVNVSEDDSGVVDLFGVQFKQRKKMKGHTGKIYDAHFCQGDSRSIISAGQEGNLIIWDGYHGDKRDVIKLEASSMWVLACAFSDSGRFVACGGLRRMLEIGRAHV